jgi:hypothetical protein
MPPRLRRLFLVLLAVLFCIPALALYREFSRRADIWWTPAPLALSLADSKDRVEIYARGQPLGTLVQQQRLSILEGGNLRYLRTGRSVFDSTTGIECAHSSCRCF